MVKFPYCSAMQVDRSWNAAVLLFVHQFFFSPFPSKWRPEKRKYYDLTKINIWMSINMFLKYYDIYFNFSAKILITITIKPYPL